MIKNDKWIKKMSFDYKMIEPFSENQIKKDNVSFGTSSYGYDARISNEFMIMKTNKKIVIDPKKKCDELFENIKVKDYIEIPPNSMVLGKSVEYFKIPRNVLTIAFGKSTYARCGIIVNVTPFEPEWEGYATISISNITLVPIVVYANEGIIQILFFEMNDVCDVSYADRNGKYNKQKKIITAKI
ncbi:MAG: dCTP deaminase [Endomicrobium sp.]|jgi:dCTP deaminase|nr:dCTP deaminase [Endomicrobium sp.]